MTIENMTPEQREQTLVRLRVELFTGVQHATTKPAMLELLRDVLAILPPNEVINLGAATVGRPAPAGEPRRPTDAEDRDMLLKAVTGVAEAHGEEELSNDAILCVVLAAAFDVRVQEAFSRIVDRARGLAYQSLRSDLGVTRG